MSVDAIEDDLAKRFRIDRPPTLLARKSSKARIGFSRMQSRRPTRSRSLPARPEEAFAFHVPLAVPFFSNLWTAGKRTASSYRITADGSTTAAVRHLRNLPVKRHSRTMPKSVKRTPR